MPGCSSAMLSGRGSTARVAERMHGSLASRGAPLGGSMVRVTAASSRHRCSTRSARDRFHCGVPDASRASSWMRIDAAVPSMAVTTEPTGTAASLLAVTRVSGRCGPGPGAAQGAVALRRPCRVLPVVQVGTRHASGVEVRLACCRQVERGLELRPKPSIPVDVDVAAVRVEVPEDVPRDSHIREACVPVVTTRSSSHTRERGAQVGKGPVTPYAPPRP
jgi:hypothetical protein